MKSLAGPKPTPHAVVASSRGTREGALAQLSAKSKIQNSPHASIDWVVALQQLADLGIKRLAVLGGGQLVASMLAADLIDEFWLTVCPLILGGVSSPTPVEGMGFDAALAPRLELVSVQAKEQEVFLHYRLQRQQRED